MDIAEAETQWVAALGEQGPARERAAARLHPILVRIARAEVRRRFSRVRIFGPELEDLAYQAAADALVHIVAKVGEFRGESRFTTWAYKFVVFEVSTKIGRHFWRNGPASRDVEDWSVLPDRFALDPAQAAQNRALVDGLRVAVEEELTHYQRRIFVAIVLNGVPLDALVADLGSSRNAIYKALFDARRKIRSSLVANGYLDERAARQP